MMRRASDRRAADDAARSSVEPAAGRPAAPAAALWLQRRAGNRAVQRWRTRALAREPTAEEEAPDETAEPFRTAIVAQARDVRRINDAITQMLPLGRFKLGADEFKRRLEWLVDQLTWVTHALWWANRLAGEAAGGSPESAKKLTEAGTHLTAAICGARAASILLAYDTFAYEVRNKNVNPSDEQFTSSFARGGAEMAHESLDGVLARLSTRGPTLVEAAADELLSYDWHWAFNQTRDNTEEAFKAHERVERWIQIAMLVPMAFDIWALAAKPGAGGTPRIGGMGGGGAAVAATALTAADSAAALRRLVALGILTAPALIKHLHIQASSTKGPRVTRLPPGPTPNEPTAVPKETGDLPEGTHKTGRTPNPRTASRGDADMLAQNLTKDVEPRPLGHSAHHVVPKGMELAEKARRILRAAGIGINDSLNGVWVPETTEVVNETTGQVHSLLHTDRYIRWLTRLLEDGAADGPAGVRQALARIREAVANGTAPR